MNVRHDKNTQLYQSKTEIFTNNKLIAACL